MTDETPYYDANGNRLTHAALKKLLKQHAPQHKWWKPKAQPRVGLGKPPPGTRETKRIKDL